MKPPKHATPRTEQEARDRIHDAFVKHLADEILKTLDEEDAAEAAAEALKAPHRRSA
jgi:hypothetical protein